MIMHIITEKQTIVPAMLFLLLGTIWVYKRRLNASYGMKNNLIV